MTNVQFIFAILLPTVTVLVGILVSKNDNSIIHADLREIRSDIAELRNNMMQLGERMARIEAK